MSLPEKLTPWVQWLKTSRGTWQELLVLVVQSAPATSPVGEPSSQTMKMTRLPELNSVLFSSAGRFASSYACPARFPVLCMLSS